MATVIRLKRGGRNKKPFYHVVVTDSRNPRDGRYIEQIGTYDPMKDSIEGFSLNAEKAVDWMKKGARPSRTVKSLFTKSGVMEKVEQQK